MGRTADGNTFVVMGASGWITQLVIRKGKEAKK